jgi:lipid-A-disaccharide synthase-like uncharacterized protein
MLKLLLIGWIISSLFVINLTIQYFYYEYKDKKNKK